MKRKFISVKVGKEYSVEFARPFGLGISRWTEKLLKNDSKHLHFTGGGIIKIQDVKNGVIKITEIKPLKIYYSV